MTDKPKKRGPKPKPSRTDSPVSVRAQAEWKAWLREFAESERQTMPGMIDLALAIAAKKKGFRPPPKRV